jgi:hypothetical protein
MLLLTGFRRKLVCAALAAGLLIPACLPVVARAAEPAGGNPQSGSIGVTGTKNAPPPDRGATIVQPSNGQHFRHPLITVSGFCPGDVLVKIYDNKVFVGAARCQNNSYRLKIGLFGGRNQLVARVFDGLGQEGPKSGAVAVFLDGARFASFGSHVLLTSDYARRGTDPGQRLDWPLKVSGGSPPYAISADWGDGSPASLKSQPFAGQFTMSHTYAHAGIYTIIFKSKDTVGSTAYLQVIAVVKGNPVHAAGGQSRHEHHGRPQVVTKIAVIPLIVLFVLSLVSFYLGRRYELLALRRKIERDSQA